MNAVVEHALNLWGMAGASFLLIAERENQVFKIEFEGKNYALRLHRQGYRSDQELWSELKWMEAVDQGGIVVPTPIASQSNQVLHVIDDIQVDMLTWLSGTTMDVTLDLATQTERAEHFFNLGREMARLHTVSDAWEQPEGFDRCEWDQDGLLGETPIWGRFWENSGLMSEDRNLFEEMRLKANRVLSNIGSNLDYGLIHADLVSANVMIDGTTVQLIDFDDGGYGYRLFEIATALVKHLDAYDYLALKQALIDGYTSLRNVDLTALDLFILIRSSTYVGWNIKRIAEDGGKERNVRFIDTTRVLARNFLKSRV